MGYFKWKSILWSNGHQADPPTSVCCDIPLDLVLGRCPGVIQVLLDTTLSITVGTHNHWLRNAVLEEGDKADISVTEVMWHELILNHNI